MQNYSSGDSTRSQNEDGASVESCNVELDTFEGPLDLLLYLVRKDEIDIYDIPVARITDQYLRYLEMMRMLNLNFAGEFLAMAATLLYIKSRTLLPPDETTEEEDEEPIEDPRAELVRQLVEYKQFKDVADELQEMEAHQHSTFRRHDVSVPLFETIQRPLSDVSIFDLLGAFSQALERAAKEGKIHEVSDEEVSVADQIEMILDRLRKEKEILFRSLFGKGAGRIAIVATFLALLELIRARRVAAVQEEPFAEIRILSR
ncbi:segregation/condensation protein A [bacterium]|nr:segregation/condensation protein A [bacterium]